MDALGVQTPLTPESEKENSSPESKTTTPPEKKLQPSPEIKSAADDDHTNSDETTSRGTSSRKDSSTAKGAKYLDALENRLRRMESLPKTSGLLSDEGGVEADRNTLEQRLADKGESSNATGSRRSLSEKKQRPDPLIYKLDS
jgi:hypothetical protein